MILRVVTGRIRPGDIDAVAASFRRSYGPAADSTRGIVRYVIGARPAGDAGHHLAAMSIWADVDSALVAYGGDLALPRTLDGADHGVAFERVDYYELEEVRTLPSGGEPILLRLTAGVVARGLDAEIQQELRARLPELPGEALEAYVGRRVLGGSVEIAFMSTWSAEPPGLHLDAPIWPAVSDRYDSFRMELHEILLAGAGRGLDDGADRPPAA